MKKKKKGESFIQNLVYDFKNNKFLLLLSLPAIAWFILFAYVPLLGLIIAFQKFSPAKGVLGSDFVGFTNFEFFFKSEAFFRVTFNTLFLNVLFIGCTMFFSIAIAILLSEITGKWFKKISQSIVILPNFISWTVIALLSEALFSTDQGLINNMIRDMGGESVAFYQDSSLWPFILTCMRIWHGAGFGSVVYLAAITGMDREIYEAAQIDGASRWQSIVHITLPLLRVTAVLLLLMSVGRIFNGDFGMIYNLIGNNTLLYRTTDVIDTYVYRQLMEANNMGMSSAVGLYQSIMGVVMVVSANALARKLDEDSALF